MKHLMDHLEKNGQAPWGTALVVGAGPGADLPVLRRLAFRRLILAEAHPRLAEDLHQRITPEAEEEIRHVAITPTPMGQATLHVLNNPQHSGIHAPRALLEQAPNLRVTHTLTVPAQSLAEIIQELQLDAEEPNLLVLDAPGAGVELLRSTPAHLLHAFSWVLLHGAAMDGLYENDIALSAAPPILHDLGFDLVQDDPEVIFPASAALLQRNAARIAVLERETHIASLQTELASAKADAERAAQDLHIRIETLQADTARLNTEHQTRIDALTQDRDQQAKTVAEQKAKLDALTQERDTLRTQAEEHKTQAG
ncbi:MAG: hypothetical protein EA399_15460, partial [Desulfovibrionales bacterium]